MHRLPFTCVEAGIAALILVPLFLALRMCYGLSWRRTAGYLLFSVYLAAVDSVVGLPSITYIRFSLNLNLEPFAYMFSDYVTSLLNVILFTPLGLLLPLFCQTFRKLWRTAVFGLLFSLSIELLQIFTLRATDINDLITNTTGTLLGWCVARVVLALAPGITPKWSVQEVPPGLYAHLLRDVFSPAVPGGMDLAFAELSFFPRGLRLTGAIPFSNFPTK